MTDCLTRSWVMFTLVASMLAAVLSVGTELTRGELVNTNACWLSEELTALGLDVAEIVTVADDRVAIVDSIRRLSNKVDVVMVTGGLGPTSDDFTTACVAEAMDVPLVQHELTLQRIRERWAARGQPMPVSNAKQADVPRGAEVIVNPVGTAAGYWFRLGRGQFFVLPGVPGEMKAMFQETVVRVLAPRIKRTSHQIHLRTFGMPESQIADALADVESKCKVTLAYRAHFPEVEIKVLARAESEAEAENRAQQAAEVVRARLGDVVYGGRFDTYPQAVGRILRERGLTLAVAESCTGGLIGWMLTSVPGSSEYLLLDAVAYANSAKTEILQVTPETLRAHGAVSSETAEAMAENGLRLAGADLCISVTGIAGPGGGSDDKPVGTVWFGLAQKNRATIAKRHLFQGDRERIRKIAAYVALQMVAQAAGKNGST